MNKIKLVIGAAVVAFAASTAMAESVRLGTEGAYPPYNFVNDNGEVDGFERELGDELCKRAELDCVWVVNDWDTIIPNLVSGNYDAIIAGMTITPERAEVVDFTKEYLPGDPSVFVAAEGADDSVMKGVVAAQTSTIQSAYVASLEEATLVEFSTLEDTVAAVRNGEADAVLASKASLTDFVNESNGELIIVGDDIAIGKGVGMALRKSDPDLRAKFDTAIKSMKDDGTLAAMITKWFPGRSTKFAE